MSARDRAIRRARAAERDERERLVTGRGGQHRDRETGERVAESTARIVAGGTLSIHFGGGNPMARLNADDREAFRDQLAARWTT